MHFSHLNFNWKDFLDEVIKNSRPRPKFDESRSTEFKYWKSNYIWTQTKEDTETPKFKKVKQLLIDSSTDAIRVKVWYQVYKPGQTYGIGVVDGVITDHPDYQFKGYPFDINKAHFETVKICEQILL